MLIGFAASHHVNHGDQMMKNRMNNYEYHHSLSGGDNTSLVVGAYCLTSSQADYLLF
jgi:hypothetical protein